jgi:hypothetical protein
MIPSEASYSPPNSTSSSADDGNTNLPEVSIIGDSNSSRCSSMDLEETLQSMRSPRHHCRNNGNRHDDDDNDDDDDDSLSYSDDSSCAGQLDSGDSIESTYRSCGWYSDSPFMGQQQGGGQDEVSMDDGLFF